ncbi:Divalent-cation tolerance protein CutA [uncultured archaeon]|nr:Divalent-cation tolerance protein CutA [uncultured archaeon]
MRLLVTSVRKSTDAARLSKALVLRGLAACASFWPVQSAYKWRGKLVQEKEYLLEIKTAKPAAARRWLEKNHPYQIPMIYSRPMGGLGAAYLKWAESGG